MDRLLSMRVFEQVVDQGSFAAAARELDMSAPVITRLVADLEDHLGTRLLQRSTRRLSLTEAGHAYLDRVRSILQDIDEAHAMTTAHTKDLAGILRLRTTPVMASYVVSPLLAGFHAQYPNIRIDIDVESVGAVAIENYDITLFAAGDSFDADVVARKLLESESVLVASRAYVERCGLPEHPADLADHDILRLKVPGVSLRSWQLKKATGHDTTDVECRPVLTANHIDTLMRAALDGAGITSVAVDIVAPFLANGSLVRILPEWNTGGFSIYAALPSRKFIPQRTRVFLDYVVEKTRETSLIAMAVS